MIGISGRAGYNKLARVEKVYAGFLYRVRKRGNGCESREREWRRVANFRLEVEGKPDRESAHVRFLVCAAVVVNSIVWFSSSYRTRDG